MRNSTRHETDPRRVHRSPDVPPGTLGAKPSLGFLMSTLTGCAVYFAVARNLLPRTPVSPSDWLWFSAFAIFTGFCWAGAGYITSSIWRQSGRLQPGEAALWCIGSLLLVEVAGLWIERVLPASSEPQDKLLPAVFISARAIIPLIPTLSRHLQPHWKGFFCWLVVLYALVPYLQSLGIANSLGVSTHLPSNLRPLLAYVALGSALAMDARQSFRGQWGHWVGLICLIVWLLPRW